MKEGQYQQKILQLEGEILAQQSIVKVVEKQRDRAESLLRAVMATADHNSMAYGHAKAHLKEIDGLDKHERRLGD